MREGAIGDEVRIATRAAVSALSGAGAKVIVCTCSTLGGIAEQSPPAGVLVLRIDRAMAERAVASGRRILVAAALASTLSPTVELLRQIAHESGRTLELVEVLCEMSQAQHQSRPHGLLGKILARQRRSTRAHTISASRESVHHHYDIGNEFYRLWLDEQLLYTCAYYAQPDFSVEQAQIAKMDHVCRKLGLRPGDRLT